MSQPQNAGFTFWERATLVQFASQATATLLAICEIADNNNPASLMHDDPRKALEQIEVLALGVQPQNRNAGQTSIPSTGQYTGSARDVEGWCYPDENRNSRDDERNDMDKSQEPPTFGDLQVVLDPIADALDDLAALGTHWTRNRERGRMPSGIRQAMLLIAREALHLVDAESRELQRPDAIGKQAPEA